MSQSYNFAILGTGMIANKMAEALMHVHGAVKYAVGSRNAGTAKEFAQKHGFVKSYGSYEDVVNDPAVDVVYIATPHNLHMSNALMCLNAGKHVLCEKPFAVNGHQVREMINLAHTKGLFLMEALWSRFLPHIIKAKDIIDEGVIGDINLLTADFCIHRPVDPLDRKFNPELIGGALLDIGIYPVFLTQLLMGMSVSMSASAAIGSTGVDYSVAASFQYAKTQLANITASFMAESGVNASVYGEKGTLKFDSFWFIPGNLTLIDRDQKSKIITIESIGNGYNYEAAEVVHCLNAGLTQSPIMTHTDSLKLIDTLDQIRQTCGIFYLGVE